LEYTSITLPPGALSYEMTSLKKFTNYSVVILGFTSKGDGNVSHQFVVSTDEDGQYDGVDVFQMFVFFCRLLAKSLSVNGANQREGDSGDRSIGLTSRLCSCWRSSPRIFEQKSDSSRPIYLLERL